MSYVLGEKLGEGTFGEVKLGTHILTGQTVAVKILERCRFKEFADIERVAREIRILQLLQHPHIISLYEIIETPSELTLITDYCSGGELFDYIVQEERISEPEAHKFFHQIMSAVEACHKAHVAHRDLKPENLLLDKRKNIKLVDFGLSTFYKEGQLLKTACGSPSYAAPEMLADKTEDDYIGYAPALTDIWSCGVVLFAMVCGSLPFEDQDQIALYQKILAANYKVPAGVNISEEVQDLIRTILAVDPKKRATFERIREHAWFAVERHEVGDQGLLNKNEIDKAVLGEVLSLGFKYDETIESLKKEQHNQATTTYKLLCSKKLLSSPEQQEARRPRRRRGRRASAQKQSHIA